MGHCVHRLAMHAARPNVLFMQKHWDVMRSDDAGDSWHEVSGNLPTDFGFPIEVHAHGDPLCQAYPVEGWIDIGKQVCAFGAIAILDASGNALDTAREPRGFAEYARLYPGFDGIAANGLKYGAFLEIRQDNAAPPGGGINGSPRSRIT